MALADDLRIQDAARRRERIHCRVDALLSDLALKHDERIQVGERGCWCRVSQVIGGHVNRLHGGDGAVLGGGDALLQGTHLRGQRRLISHGARHAAEQCGYLGACLCETEHVVDEQQGFLTALVAEVLCHRERAQCHAQTCAWRLVHLTEHHGHLVQNVHLLPVRIGVLGFLHFQPEIVAFAGALADAGEH